MLAFCHREGFPLEGGCRVLCAVSGGVDSMMLLHFLWRQSREGSIRLTAATFDHRLRPESAGDVDFVLRWCREHEIPCHTGSGDVAGFAQKQGMTLEEAGRALRYRFLEDCRIFSRCLARSHTGTARRHPECRGFAGCPQRRETARQRVRRAELR